MSVVRKDLVSSWKPFLRALDPLREVGLDEIEQLYAERQASPYKALATDLAIADRPAELKLILCGARGSGKSTELTRLASEEGVRMLCALYERRRLAAAIPPELFTKQMIERAASMSSGIIREFLSLLHSTCKNALGAARTKLEPADLELAIKARRLELEGYLDEGHLKILRRVLDKGVLPAAERADTLLFENFIACYPNGDIWFRPHELIVEFVAARQEPD